MMAVRTTPSGISSSAIPESFNGAGTGLAAIASLSAGQVETGGATEDCALELP
jgi:hypothetical protein